MVLTSEQATRKIRQKTSIDAETLKYADEISDGKLDLYLPQCQEFIRDWLFDRLVTDDCGHEQEAIWKLLLKTYKRSKIKPSWKNVAPILQRVLSLGPSVSLLECVCEFIHCLKSDNVSLRMKIEQSTQLLKTYLDLCTQIIPSKNCNDTFFSLYELSLFGNPNRKHCLALFEEQCLLLLVELLSRSELVSNIVHIFGQTIFSVGEQKLSPKTLSSIPPDTRARFLHLMPLHLSSEYINYILALPVTSNSPKYTKQLLEAIVAINARPPTALLSALADHSVKTKDWSATALLLQINGECILPHQAELFSSNVSTDLATLLFQVFLRRRQTPEFLKSWSKASTSPWTDVDDELFQNENLISHCAKYVESQLSMHQINDLLRQLHGPPLYSLLISIQQERYIEQAKPVLSQMFSDADAFAKFLILRLVPSLKTETVQIRDLRDVWHANLFLRLHELEVCELPFDRILSDKMFEPRMLIRWPFLFEKYLAPKQKAEVAEVAIEKVEVVSNIFKSGQVLECRDLSHALFKAIASKMKSQSRVCKTSSIANTLLLIPANAIPKGTRGKLIDYCAHFPDSKERFVLLDHLWCSPTPTSEFITKAPLHLKLLGEERQDYSPIISKIFEFLMLNISKYENFFDTLVEEILKSDLSRAYARLASVLMMCLPSDNRAIARLSTFVVKRSSKQLNATNDLTSLTWCFQALAQLSHSSLLEIDNHRMHSLLVKYLSTSESAASHDSLLENVFLIVCKTKVEPLATLALYSVLVEEKACRENDLNEYSKDYWNTQSELVKCGVLKEIGSCRNPLLSYAAQRVVLRAMKKDNETREFCSNVILDLCHSLCSLADERCIRETLFTISTVIKTASWMVNGTHVEALVAGITILCSNATQDFHVNDVNTFFEDMVNCVSASILQQGHHLKHHAHLLSGMLQQMLYCFDQRNGGKGGRKPLWLGADQSFSTVSARLYARLVSTLCDSVSLQHSSSSQMTLISASDRYGKTVAKHIPYLLLQIIQLQLATAFSNDVKLCFDGVIFTLFEVFDGGQLRMISSIADSSSRMYFKMLYERYTKDRKWKGS